MKGLRTSLFKRLAAIGVLSITLFSVACPAVAVPSLTTPANGATVTNNYPSSSPASWIPYLSWTDNRLTEINKNYVEIATNPTVNQNFGTFLPNYLAASTFIPTTYWDVANSSWPDYPFYLTPGTYYWHVRGQYGYSFNYDFEWSPIYSFTVPPAPPTPAPIIAFTPGNFYFVINQGGAVPPSQKLTLINLGANAVTYYLAWDYGYINLTIPDALRPAEISVNPWAGLNTLAPGIYNDRITITGQDNVTGSWANNQPQYINVTVEIKAPGEALIPTPTPAAKIILSTSLSLSAKPKVIKLGKRTFIKGKLLDSSGKPVAGRKLKIKVKRKVIKTLTTNAAGAFSFKHKPKKTTLYKAYFNGDGSYKATGPKSVKVVVKRN